jgi:hypothetical protein
MNKMPKTVASAQAGKEIPFNKKPNWTPLEGMSLTSNVGIKTSGVKTRGNGAATNGEHVTHY